MQIKTMVATLGLACCAASTSSYGTVITGNGVHSINGPDAFVSAYDQAVVNLLDGADVAFLDTRDQSHVNIHGGELSWLNMYEQSTADIYKVDLSWLLLAENSTAHIYGSNFFYSGGHLSGNWSDGSAFSFWALNANSRGMIENPSPVSMPANISLHSVPLPGTLYLFGAALFPLMGSLRQSGRT